MKKEIANILLDIKAVALSPNNPFTWASGILSPIYCDNRLILSYPKERVIVENGLVELIKLNYPNVDVIVGTATAGIPHAAIIADKLNLPMAYVRSSKKGHGKGNQIEGRIEKGANVVVIEDLISTGKSSLQVVEALRDEEINVLGIASIFTYSLEIGKCNFRDAMIKNISLTTINDLLEVALETKSISEADVNKIKKWIINPSDENWINSK